MPRNGERKGARRAPADVPPGLRVMPVGDDIVLLSYDLTRHGRPLTSAERAVLRLLLEGESNAHIAKSRATSERTVANQVSSIFRKLGVRSRSELVARRDLVLRA